MSASALREGTKVTFADGKTRTIYPLTIRQLRKFMKAVKDLKTDTTDLEDEDVDKMVEAAAIALEKDYPMDAADLEGLEDILDLRSFNELLGAAMGADPNE